MKMMDLPELIILDVGHGNCALVRDANEVIIIDCPPGGTLVEALEHLSIKEILHILISHSDADHIGGIIDLLANKDIKIHNIHLNPDSLKKSNLWTDIRIALRDARQRSKIIVSSELTTTKTGSLNIGSVSIEILAPTPELILGGAGGTDLKGRKLTSNSISSVIGIVHDSHRIAVLAADIDNIGFENLIQEGNKLTADLLVFPHHGGRPGSGDIKMFAQQLCNYIEPKLIIFSLDRNRFSNNPHIEIIEGLSLSVPNAHILCTQLSQQCTAILPIGNPVHLSSIPAKGLISNSCCGGTILVKINGSRTNYPEIALHKSFVDQVNSPICRKFLPMINSGSSSND